MRHYDKTLNMWTVTLLQPLLRRVPQSVTPNDITILGASVAAFVGVLGIFVLHNPQFVLWSGLVVAATFDIFDGALARYRCQQTVLGKWLDAGGDIIFSIVYTVYLVSLFQSSFVLGFVLVLLYAVRFWLVVRNKEVEVGGLRPTILIVGLIVYYLGSQYVTLGLVVVCLWNLISIILSIVMWSSPRKQFSVRTFIDTKTQSILSKMNLTKEVTEHAVVKRVVYRHPPTRY